MLARLDDLEVDVRHLATEREQIDDVDLVDTDDAVRVAEAEVHHRADRGGIRASAHPSGSGSGSTGPMSTVARIVCRVVGGFERHRPRAGVGHDQLVAEVAAAGGQCLSEATDPVAAHLCPTAVGVEQHHPRRIPRLALGDQQAVGTESAPAVAQSPSERRQVGLGKLGMEHDEEVVAESVVLGEGDLHRLRSSVRCRLGYGTRVLAARGDDGRGNGRVCRVRIRLRRRRSILAVHQAGP